MYELIKTLFALAKMNNVNLCIFEKQIYIIKELNSDFARLSPISEPEKDIITYNPEDLITSNKLSKTALKPLFNGLETELQRVEIGTTTAQKRNENGTKTELQRVEIGTTTAATIAPDKVNLKKFSESCPESCRELSEKLEALFEKILNKTNKKTTIEKIIKLHKQAAAFAANENVYQLRQLEKRLQGIKNKQTAIKTSEQTIDRRRNRRKMFLKIATFTAAAAVVVFLIFRKINESPPRSLPVCAASVENKDFLNSYFDEYEKKSGKKIYPAGRECLRRACGNETDKDKIFQIIKKNMN